MTAPKQITGCAGSSAGSVRHAERELLLTWRLRTALPSSCKKIHRSQEQSQKNNQPLLCSTTRQQSLQMSKHGAGTAQGQSPGLEGGTQLEEPRESQVVLHVMALLCNCHSSKFGMNHILKTFMSKTKGLSFLQIAGHEVLLLAWRSQTLVSQFHDFCKLLR